MSVDNTSPERQLSEAIRDQCYWSNANSSAFNLTKCMELLQPWSNIIEDAQTEAGMEKAYRKDIETKLTAASEVIEKCERALIDPDPAYSRQQALAAIKEWKEKS